MDVYSAYYKEYMSIKHSIIFEGDISYVDKNVSYEFYVI